MNEIQRYSASVSNHSSTTPGKIILADTAIVQSYQRACIKASAQISHFPSFFRVYRFAQTETLASPYSTSNVFKMIHFYWRVIHTQRAANEREENLL